MSTTTITTTKTDASEPAIVAEEEYIDYSVSMITETCRSALNPKRYFPKHVLAKVYSVHESRKCCFVETNDFKRYFVRMDQHLDRYEEMFSKGDLLWVLEPEDATDDSNGYLPTITDWVYYEPSLMTIGTIHHFKYKAKKKVAGAVVQLDESLGGFSYFITDHIYDGNSPSGKKLETMKIGDKVVVYPLYPFTFEAIEPKSPNDTGLTRMCWFPMQEMGEHYDVVLAYLDTEGAHEMFYGKSPGDIINMVGPKWRHFFRFLFSRIPPPQEVIDFLNL